MLLSNILKKYEAFFNASYRPFHIAQIRNASYKFLRDFLTKTILILVIF